MWVSVNIPLPVVKCRIYLRWRGDGAKRTPKRARYFHSFTSDLAREALESSDNFYWKVDGSCGIITYDTATDELSFHQRMDTRGKEPTSTLMDLPAGKNPTKYLSKNQPHSYYMEQVKVSENDGKKAKKKKLALR